MIQETPIMSQQITNEKLEIRSVERGICPIAESIMTEASFFNEHVWKCLISIFISGLNSDTRNA